LTTTRLLPWSVSRTSQRGRNSVAAARKSAGSDVSEATIAISGAATLITPALPSSDDAEITLVGVAIRYWELRSMLPPSPPKASARISLESSTEMRGSTVMLPPLPTPLSTLVVIAASFMYISSPPPITMLPPSPSAARVSIDAPVSIVILPASIVTSPALPLPSARAVTCAPDDITSSFVVTLTLPPSPAVLLAERSPVGPSPVPVSITLPAFTTTSPAWPVTDSGSTPSEKPLSAVTKPLPVIVSVSVFRLMVPPRPALDVNPEITARFPSSIDGELMFIWPASPRPCVDVAMLVPS
jgi:hypothetical protein